MYCKLYETIVSTYPQELHNETFDEIINPFPYFFPVASGDDATLIHRLIKLSNSFLAPL